MNPVNPTQQAPTKFVFPTNPLVPGLPNKSGPIAGGQQTVGSVKLTTTGLNNGAPQAPVTMTNKTISVSQYSGSGAPTFSANTGSIYEQTDVGQFWINVSAAPGGTTWSQVPTLGGNQTFTGTNTFTQTIIDTNTTLSFNGSGPIEAVRGGGSTTTYVPPVYNHSGAAAASDAHLVRDDVNINNGVTATITLTGDAVFTTHIEPIVTGDAATTLWTVSASSSSVFTIKNNDAVVRTFRYIVLGD